MSDTTTNPAEAPKPQRANMAPMFGDTLKSLARIRNQLSNAVPRLVAPDDHLAAIAMSRMDQKLEDCIAHMIAIFDPTIRMCHERYKTSVNVVKEGLVNDPIPADPAPTGDASVAPADRPPIAFPVGGPA